MYDVVLRHIIRCVNDKSTPINRSMNSVYGCIEGNGETYGKEQI